MVSFAGNYVFRLFLAGSLDDLVWFRANSLATLPIKAWACGSPYQGSFLRGYLIFLVQLMYFSKPTILLMTVFL